MNKTDKIIIIFYIFLASSFGLYVLTYDVGLDESLLEVVTPKKITEFETSRLVDVPNNRIFDVIANIENFPNVIPENVVNVNILNKTDNEIIAEEELFEAGIKVKLLVKHTIKPYSEHIIEIIDGDAEGTTITQYFESVDSQTKLTTNVDLKVKGVTALIAFLPEAELVHAINTVISHFVDYSKYDVYEIMVNSLYQEILDQQADEESLLHFSALLRDGHITEQDLRSTLFNSKEALRKQNIDDLDEETINVINDLYRKILLRESDPEGLLYYGNLFESGMTLDEIRAVRIASCVEVNTCLYRTDPLNTKDEIRAMFLESAEAKDLNHTHPVRIDIRDTFKRIFDCRLIQVNGVDTHFYLTDCVGVQAGDSVVNYYHKMIDDDGFVLFPDWVRTILDWQHECKEVLTGCAEFKLHVAEVDNAIKFLYNEGIIFPSICDVPLPFLQEGNKLGINEKFTTQHELKKGLEGVLGSPGLHALHTAEWKEKCSSVQYIYEIPI